MPYYDHEELTTFGFNYLGENVKVSRQANIYDAEKISLGSNSRIDDFCIISGRVTVGRFCHITPMCLVAGGIPGVVMGDFVTLAYGTKVFAQSDDYSGRSMVNSLIPKKFKNEYLARVEIEKHSIVGANSTIMPGVTLAEGTAVGSTSLVLASTSPWGIYAGCPALRIKERRKDLLELEREFLNENSV